MTIEEFVDNRLKDKNFVHDFSLGALFAYHGLEKLVEKGKAKLGKNHVTMELRNHDYIIAFNQIGDLKTAIEETNLNKKVKVSSYTTIPLLSENKVSKQEEIFYQLDNIDKKYSGKKKYHSYYKPIRIIEDRPDLNITLEDFENASALRQLHDEWRDYKLSLPKTHRITFPTAKYRNTLDDFPIPTFRKAIYVQGQLYGYIVFSLEGETAFLLSFVTLYWKPELQVINGLNQYILSYCMITLQEKHGIRFINAGFASTKGLKNFKHCVQKSNSVYRYTYEV